MDNDEIPVVKVESLDAEVIRVVVLVTVGFAVGSGVGSEVMPNIFPHAAIASWHASRDAFPI